MQRLIAMCFCLLLMGCSSLERLVSGREGQKLESKESGTIALNPPRTPVIDTSPIRIMGSGQSNANNDIIWPELAKRIEEYTGRPVLWKVFAMSNTSSVDWSTNKFGLLDGLKTASEEFQPEYFFWIQGEGDSQTSAEDYADNIKIVMDVARRASPSVQFQIALDGWYSASPRNGQESLIDQGLAHRGVDIDHFRTPYCSPPDPHSNPHFIDPCKIQIADAWFDMFKLQLKRK